MADPGPSVPDSDEREDLDRGHQDHAPPTVSLREALWVWAKIGLLSFGGPAGQIALMHQELVERRRWIDDERFGHALSYCMLLPGPEAQQLATYLGWLLHRTRGGLAAGILFVFPGFLYILAISFFYSAFRALPAVAALLVGMKAAVVAIVADALRRVGSRSLRTREHHWLAIGAFIALFALKAPFPLVVLGAGSVGWLMRDRQLATAPPLVQPPSQGSGRTRPSVTRALRVLTIGSCLWGLPLLLLSLVFGRGSIWVEQGWFFSKAAVVTFGGAYSVLAYVAQHAVHELHWLSAAEMLDGLGLAETTPGPLILVLEFVGFLGALQRPGQLPPLVSATLGAVVTVWVTFVPCFLWIFLGAPHIEALRRNRAVRAALSAVSAAVVGVIANLSLWFSLHVLFAKVSEVGWGVFRVSVPTLVSLNTPSALLTALALLGTLRWRWSAPTTLLVCSTLGAAMSML